MGNIVAFTGSGNIEPLNTLENEPASKFAPYRSVYLPKSEQPRLGYPTAEDAKVRGERPVLIVLCALCVWNICTNVTAVALRQADWPNSKHDNID